MTTRIPNESRCTHRDARNHRCRMALAPSHPSLCSHHAQLEQGEREAADLGAQLASPSGRFHTASDLNHVLGHLFRLLAEKRIDRARAHTLAYIAQLLLFTLDTVRHEMQTVQGVDAWEKAVLRAFSPPRFANRSSGLPSSADSTRRDSRDCSRECDVIPSRPTEGEHHDRQA